jgi:acetyl-CoA synthetase
MPIKETTTMLPIAQDYATLYKSFHWNVPARYNIGIDACDKWADGSGRLALIHETRHGEETRYTFDELKTLSDQFANALRSQGVVRGERVAVLLPQCPETALTHLAAYKSGAIAVPLFTLFGVEALQFRLANSGATTLITDRQGYEKISALRDTLPDLKTIFCADMEEALEAELAAGLRPFWPTLRAQPSAFTAVDTSPDDPALVVYTSGTTGKPKGALHAHRVLLGHLPGVEMSQMLFPAQAGLMWTPADWAWIGGLMDVLLPSWHHGVPVLSRRFEKFDAQAAFDLMARHGVTHTFLPPTALKMLRGAPPDVLAAHRGRLALRSVASGGESLGEELIEWGRAALGVTINEFYGQTECNMVLSSCGALFPPHIGAIGRVVPGHDVRIVNDEGQPLTAGEEGNIGVRSPDPVMFLGYWNNPDATRAKYAGDYLLTGDLGIEHDDGFIRFVGRNDDVITSAGYRIGPGPIEDCLIGHAAVRMAAVIGIPDQQRTEIVKAFIILNPGFEPGDALVLDIQAHVRTRLAAHEYPRAVSFVDELPMTATGKIIRKALREAPWS